MISKNTAVVFVDWRKCWRFWLMTPCDLKSMFVRASPMTTPSNCIVDVVLSVFPSFWLRKPWVAWINWIEILIFTVTNTISHDVLQTFLRLHWGRKSHKPIGKLQGFYEFTLNQCFQSVSGHYCVSSLIQFLILKLTNGLKPSVRNR